jgi:hypothetical protein
MRRLVPVPNAGKAKQSKANVRPSLECIYRCRGKGRGRAGKRGASDNHRISFVHSYTLPSPHPSFKVKAKAKIPNLIIDIALHLELHPALLVHLPVRRPAEQAKRADDEQPADERGGGQRAVERRGEQLVYDGDDEDGEEGGDGGEDGGGQADEDEEGAGEGWVGRRELAGSFAAGVGIGLDGIGGTYSRSQTR